MKVLFICNQNQHRSKRAEELFKERFETRSAGLYSDKPVEEETIRWADIVVVMDDEQRKELGNRFPLLYLQKRIISLDISDIYTYGDPTLDAQLLSKVDSLIQS